MNIYNVNDESFKNSLAFKDYLNNNSGIGYLKVRAYTANEAIPVKGVQITVTKNIEDAKVIFFSGVTDESGIIDNISLPAPEMEQNNLETPISSKYELTATYNNNSKTYILNMYDNIYVIQTINITPTMNMGGY